MRGTALITVLIGCALPCLAQKVTVDWDRGLDMSAWRVFTWSEDSTRPKDDLARARVEDAILDAFVAKGMEAGDGEVDFVIRYHAIVDKKTKQSSVRLGLGMSRRVGSHGAVSVGTSTAPKSKTVEVGTLVVDVLDSETGNVAWTATCTETLKGDPEKRRAQIDAVLEKALAEFPPAP